MLEIGHIKSTNTEFLQDRSPPKPRQVFKYGAVRPQNYDYTLIPEHENSEHINAAPYKPPAVTVEPADSEIEQNPRLPFDSTSEMALQVV